MTGGVGGEVGGLFMFLLDNNDKSQLSQLVEKHQKSAKLSVFIFYVLFQLQCVETY